jgi:6-phosphogluconolactonase
METPMTPELIVKRPEELAAIFADRLAGLASRGRIEGRPVGVALPGGSVAEAFFPVLARANIDWSLIEWFWGDERAVPRDHADSNFRVAHELLFSQAAIDSAHVHRMHAEASDLEAAASDYESELMTTLGVPPRLDLVLLGMGPDGHVCSLFPGHPALDESSRFVVPVIDSPKPPLVRLTLTLPALADAVVVLAAFGASKAAAVQDVLENRSSSLPAARALRAARHAIVMTDLAAVGNS